LAALESDRRRAIDDGLVLHRSPPGAKIASMPRFVDLSVPVASDKDWAPRWARTVVKHQDHAYGRRVIRLMLRLPAKYLKTGLGWAHEQIKLSTHGTTHLDAPWHYAPTSEGKPARTIDEVPLEWCYGDGVVLDMRHKRNGEMIGVADVEQALDKIGYRLKAADIVLIETGGDRLLGDRAYYEEGVGVDADATRWLLDQGVRVTGIDAWGWDGPLAPQARRAKETGRDDVFWASHYVGVEKEYCHLERLANLDALPPHGFKVCCFPLKIERGSAGPTRVVAILDE
jgi:kynurenine formamidase